MNSYRNHHEAKQPNSSPRKKQAQSRLLHRPLKFEPLEDRRLLASTGTVPILFIMAEIGPQDYHDFIRITMWTSIGACSMARGPLMGP
jgi:hypothetical protein